MLLLLVITSLLHSVFSILVVPFQHLDFVLGVCRCFLLCQELCLAIRLLKPLVRSFQADQRHMFGRLE